MSSHSHIHTNFRLNEQSFTSISSLLDYSKTISDGVHAFLSAWFDQNDFIRVQTSGSTGTPKSIALKKRHMRNSALMTAHYFNLFQDTKALLCLSPDFIAGKMMVVRALVLGWHLDVITPSSDPLKGNNNVYDFSAMVPLQLYNTVDRLDQIKKLLVGGGTVSNDLEQKTRTLNTEVYATYGMTETSTHIAVRRLNTVRGPTSAERERPPTYYELLPHVSISTDERGCLVIKAPRVAEHVVITNDLVTILSPKTFQWLGRYDHIINSGGVKLIPEQIEQKLAKVIDQRFFVAGIADEILGEKLILVVESTKKDEVILNEVKNLESLRKFEIPKHIYFLDSFIETETKKINRKRTLGQLSMS